MTSATLRIKRTLVYSTCAVALGAIGSVANAHTCMKKPHGHGYMAPMYPGKMQGYSGPARPYKHPSQGYGAPGHGQGAGSDSGNTGENQGPGTAPKEAKTGGHEPDIIETATAAGEFNTLIKAVVAADLYDTLRGEGPFTVFAPTDAAFADLPDGTLDGLLADKDKLAAVLSYHVVPGRLTAADLLQQREFKTVQGQTLSINDIDVVSADNEASNGIVHVIKNVVVPSM